MADLTLIPSDEPLELVSPSTDIDEADAAIINAQAAIEKDTIDWSEGFRKFQNYEVAAYFEKVRDDSLPMQSQKDYWVKLCTITEEDGLLKAIGKYQLFDRLRGADFGDLAKVYGIPIEEFGEKVRHKPQITLKFRELEINQEDLPVRDYKLVKEVSFRLLGNNIPESKDQLSELREKILNEFNEYSYEVSSSETYTYRDLNNGYRLAIDCSRETFIQIATKCLAIQDLNYDEQYLGVGNVSRPNSIPTTTALGSQVNLPFRGRYGKVHFWKCEYKQAGIEDRIIAANIPVN